MKQKLIQQEIILPTGTGISGKELSYRQPGQPDLSENDKLKEACWNGLLGEIIPELFEQQGNPNKLFLWQIMEARFFILLEMGEFPLNIDKDFSIDPYYFLSSKSGN